MEQQASNTSILVGKRWIASTLFHAAMLLTYFCSLHAWPLWPIDSYYPLLVCALLLPAMAVSNSMSVPFFCRRNFLPPMIAYILLLYYQLFVNGANFNGFLVQSFNIVIFLALFRISHERLIELSTFLAKAMAILVCVTLPPYILYQLGLPLPCSNISYGDKEYNFSNYYFFLIEDGVFYWSFLPRFHSIFLEPGHFGTATVLLLLSQMGKWRRWYNVVLIIGTLLSFSLAAYVLIVCVMVLNSWCQRRRVFLKLAATVGMVAAVVVGSFFYNGGDNLIHDLIVIRLEVDDGELAGDNRVTEDFQTEFDSFLTSSDVLLGRDIDYSAMEKNSGFRVYIYENGLIGLMLVIVFYLVAFAHTPDRRAWVAAMVIGMLCFIVRGYPLWYNIFIPLLCTVYTDFASLAKKSEATDNARREKAELAPKA